MKFRRLAALTGGHNDTSGGFSEVGRRQYTLRYAGQYELPDFGEMVLDLAWRKPGSTCSDIATIDVVMRDSSGFMLQNGRDSIAFNAQVEKGVNVLEVMADLKDAVAELQAGPLQREGLAFGTGIRRIGLHRRLDRHAAYEPADWYSTCDLYTLVVHASTSGPRASSHWRFRFHCSQRFSSCRSTGRTLNMISLAGLAFATGMVLDAAIVVLENIVRLREKGEDARKSGN